MWCIANKVERFTPTESDFRLHASPPLPIIYHKIVEGVEVMVKDVSPGVFEHKYNISFLKGNLLECFGVDKFEEIFPLINSQIKRI